LTALDKLVAAQWMSSVLSHCCVAVMLHVLLVVLGAWLVPPCKI
jgi:hypothetical protein